MPDNRIARELKLRNSAYDTIMSHRIHSRIDQALDYLMEAVKSDTFSQPELKAMVMGVEQALKDSEEEW